MFLLIFICSSFNFFANGLTERDPVLHKSISKIIENKIYVKDDAIKVNKNGIFLRIQGELVPISKLIHDDKGVYFDFDETAGWDMPPLCPTCGSPWVIFYCSNPNCPSNK